MELRHQFVAKPLEHLTKLKDRFCNAETILMWSVFLTYMPLLKWKLFGNSIFYFTGVQTTGLSAARKLMPQLGSMVLILLDKVSVWIHTFRPQIR